MDDNEYYSMMRRQYSNPIKISKGTDKSHKASLKTAGTYSDWNVKYGHEDVEMFLERNQDEDVVREKD